MITACGMANTGNRLVHNRIDLFGRHTLGFNIRSRLGAGFVGVLRRACRRVSSSGSTPTLRTVTITR